MVLNFLNKSEIKTFISSDGKKVINYFTKKAIFAQPELVDGQNPTPVHIPKEHIEQWFVQALGAKPTGAGSYPVDIVKGKKWAADVKMLSCKVNQDGSFKVADSGETSLGQKFRDVGQGLDQLFANSSYNKITDEFLKIFKTKYKKVKNEKGINVFYYIIILRAGSNFYLSILKLDLDKVERVKCIEDRVSETSIWLKNFIAKDYGSVKIYKSKKRMELRLRPKELFNNNLLYKLDVEFEPKTKNILSIVNNQEKLKEYVYDLFNDFFD